MGRGRKRSAEAASGRRRRGASAGGERGSPKGLAGVGGSNAGGGRAAGESGGGGGCICIEREGESGPLDLDSGLIQRSKIRLILWIKLVNFFFFY